MPSPRKSSPRNSGSRKSGPRKSGPRKSAPRSGDFHRSGCPIASTLDLVGDRWSLVVVRDMINGKRRFGELLAGPEGIPTNILADRLRRLEAHGLVRKEPYQERPRRNAYVLTERGAGLHPILQAICRWGNAHIPNTWIPPDAFMAPVD